MPTLTQLEYALAVEKTRHFGRAADMCHVSQPTLSMQIQKVEGDIGYPLFDRLKKPVLPTDKGRRFLAQAKVILREHHKLMDLSRRQSGAVSGDFRLGVIPTLAPYLLPRFIGAFAAAYPEVRLAVDELRTDSILGRLADDRLDAGLLATPLDEPGLTERPLFTEPFYLYAGPRHPLHAQRRVTDKDLRGEEMWLLEDGHCFGAQIERFCGVRDRAGVFANVRFAGGSIDTLRNLVRAARGYTLVPALFVETLADPERRACVRELAAPAPAREVGLIYRRDQWKKDILAGLASTIVENIPKSLLEIGRRRQNVLAAR